MEGDDRLPAAGAHPRSFGEKHRMEASWAAITAQKAGPLYSPKGIVSDIPVGKVKEDSNIAPLRERENTSPSRNPGSKKISEGLGAGDWKPDRSSKFGRGQGRNKSWN